MPISIEQFKQAFAGNPADDGDGLAERDRKVESALLTLKERIRAVTRPEAPDKQLEGGLRKLVMRYEAARKETRQPARKTAAEFDDILRLTTAMIDRVGPPPAGPVSPPVTSPPAPAPGAEMPPTAEQPSGSLDVARESPATGKSPAPAVSFPEGPATVDQAPKTDAPAGAGQGDAPPSSGPGARGTSAAKVTLKILVQGQGQPIAGAIVWVGDVSERSGSDGWARLSLTPGSYPYQVSAPGYQQATGRFEVTDAPEQPDSVYLYPIEQGAEAEVVVRVRDKVTRRKIEAALVRLGNDVGQTDSAGAARFIAVEYGEQTYHVSMEGYETDRGTLKTGKPKVTLDVELQPVRTGEPSPEGEPPATGGQEQPGGGVTLKFNVQAVQKLIEKALVVVGKESRVTDSGGNAEFTVTAGTHRYSVSASGFQDMEGDVDISADEPIQHHGVVLHPVESHEGDAIVRVLDAVTRRPVPECTVRLADELGRTDAAGEAKFLGVRYDAHRLVVMRSGYENHAETILHAETTPKGLIEVQLQPLAPGTEGT